MEHLIYIGSSKPKCHKGYPFFARPKSHIGVKYYIDYNVGKKLKGTVETDQPRLNEALKNGKISKEDGEKLEEDARSGLRLYPFSHDVYNLGAFFGRNFVYVSTLITLPLKGS